MILDDKQNHNAELHYEGFARSKTLKHEQSETTHFKGQTRQELNQ